MGYFLDGLTNRVIYIAHLEVKVLWFPNHKADFSAHRLLIYIFRVPHWAKLDTGESFSIAIGYENTTNDQNNCIISIGTKMYTTSVPWNSEFNQLTLGTPNNTFLINYQPVSSSKFKGCLTSAILKFSNSVDIDLEVSDPSSSVPTFSTLLVETIPGCEFDDVCQGFETSPCQNNGTCSNVFGGYECVNCSEGFHGLNCEFNKTCEQQNPCDGDLECTDVEDSFECKFGLRINGRSFSALSALNGVRKALITLNFLLKYAHKAAIMPDLINFKCSFFTDNDLKKNMKFNSKL